LIRLVKKKIEEHPKRWHEVLTEALWAHRVSKHGATKVTHFKLVYGQEAVLPVKILLQGHIIVEQDTLMKQEYRELMMDMLDEVTEDRFKALKEIEKEKIRTTCAYNKRVRENRSRWGDLV
jgi:hypothetical protein